MPPTATIAALQPPPPASVKPTSVSEMKSFLAAAEGLEKMRRENPSIFRHLLEAISVYNTHRKAADVAVRKLQVSCGPWELKQWRAKFDAQVLFDAVGREKFGALGGHLEVQDVLTIEKERFAALATSGKIPEDLVAKIVSWSPVYDAPKEIVGL